MATWVLITGYDDLPQEDIDTLWEQGVDLNDWEIILIGPPESVEPYYSELAPIDWKISRMLGRSQKWYQVVLRGQPVAVGVS